MIYNDFDDDINESIARSHPINTGEIETIKCVLTTLNDRLKSMHIHFSPEGKQPLEAAIGCGEMMYSALINVQTKIETN